MDWEFPVSIYLSVTYLLKALSDASHEVEQYYTELEKGESMWNQDTLLEGIDVLENLVKEYQDVGENKLGWQISNRSVKIPASIIEDVVKRISSTMDAQLNDQQLDNLRYCLSSLCRFSFVTLNDVFEEVCSGIDSMARDLKKEVPEVRIESEAIILKDEGVNLLHGILVHIIRNSMDHGIETPEERSKLGKRTQVLISFKVTVLNSGQLELQYRDDGSGLNLPKIRKIALAKEGRRDSDFTEEDLIDCIFQTGFTTKDDVSDISGRGVGMGAAKEYIEDKGGSIQVRLLSETDQCRGRPFIVAMIIPEGLWFLSKDLNLVQVA